MISVDEAEERIFEHLPTAQIRQIPLSNLQTEVIRESLLADRNFPPFHRVAMDGVSIAFSSWERGLRRFRIEGAQKAGQPAQKLHNEENCFEVATGAVLPLGSDCVIPSETVEIREDEVHLRSDLQLRRYQNVHRDGSDYQAGDLLVGENTEMLSPHWAIAASVGKRTVQISKRPKIAVLSTGDELVDAGQTPLPHQIRGSNAYALLSSLTVEGFSDVSVHHLPDNRKTLREGLQSLLRDRQVLIISGGISVGKSDFVPGALGELNVREVFHKVRQKPGKPFWFGLGSEKQAVFGLPGNPVSALICFHRYVLPGLKTILGVSMQRRVNRPYAVLKKDVRLQESFTHFLPVRLEFDKDGRILAWPVKVNGSGDLTSLAFSDGFIELFEGQPNFSAGAAFPLWTWRGL